ncbi:MAG: hypothetical protein ACLQU4_12840 [Limisphaerales bacterium]
MKANLYFRSFVIVFAAVAVCHSAEQVHTGAPPVPSYLMSDYDETGRPLPPGVPRAVDTNGHVVYVPHSFTSKLYRDAALKLVVQEANQVSQELKLPEELPITVSNIESYISPFGFAYAHRMVGTVTTKKYVYCVSLSNRFSYLEGTHQLEDCQKYLEKYRWPVSRIDTNTAYQLATQWLAAVHMDVAALNADCRLDVTVDNAYVQAPPGKFVPIYWISWIPRNGESPCAADVRLFTPTKALLQLRVEDPKYILRTPLVFTNLAALFPGIAPIHTNYPVKTIYMPPPPLE